jgi:putative colanic acid biosynthesis acetyltransferase WcaF
VQKVRLDRFDHARLERRRSRGFEVLWMLARWMFIDTAFPWPYSVKRQVLRLFGARVGKGLVMLPRVYVHHPWQLEIGDHCWVGAGTQLLSVEKIRLEDHAALAHDVYLAAGGHDIGSATMAPDNRPITVKSGCWIATRAFVGPGVTIGENSVVGAGAVVVRDVEPGMTVVGNPAKPVGPRTIERP